MQKALVTFTAAAALFVGVASAQAARTPFRADYQAEHYLEHGLKTWAGIDLRTADFKSASCLNGYYSKHEQRTGRHYPQGRQSRSGENLFHSFSCGFSVDGRDFNLYVVITRSGWRVSADH